MGNSSKSINTGSVQLAGIRAAICPAIDQMAAGRVIEADPGDFANSAEGVTRMTGDELGKMEHVPNLITAEIMIIHNRLNQLLARLGTSITDVAELFEIPADVHESWWNKKVKMLAGIDTNTENEADYNGGTVARVTFQQIPMGVPAVELRANGEILTSITETASLDVMRTANDGDRWVEVATSRMLHSDEAQYGSQTAERARLFYNPRNPDGVLPFLRLTRENPQEPNLAIYGSEAWRIGIRAIHATIDLVESAEMPPRQS